MRPHSLLVVPFALLLAACEAPGPQPPVAVNHVHASATPTVSPSVEAGAPASPAPSDTPAAPAAAAPGRCHTGGLLISFAGSQGAAGTIFDTFRVANTQQSPCTLYGYVGMLMLDASGAPLEVGAPLPVEFDRWLEEPDANALEDASTFDARLRQALDARWALGTPAYGIYYGVGVQWRNVLPGLDVGLDYRYDDSVARDHLLPSDPVSPIGRPDSFYDITGEVLSLSYHF